MEVIKSYKVLNSDLLQRTQKVPDFETESDNEVNLKSKNLDVEITLSPKMHKIDKAHTKMSESRNI